MTHNFSEKTIELLTKAGWHPDRRINIDHIVEHVESNGYEVFPAAREFFTEFGDLNIIYNDIRILTFDFTHSHNLAKNYESSYEVVQYYHQAVKKPLCVLGSDNSGHEVLFMDSDGAVYGSEWNDWKRLLLYGYNCYQFIENFLNGIPRPPYRKIAPVFENEDSNESEQPPVIATVILEKYHDPNASFRMTKSKLNQYDNILLSKGHTVYFIDPDAEPDSDQRIYQSLNGLPEPVDIIVFHIFDDSKKFLALEDQITASGAQKVYIPFNRYDPPIGDKIGSVTVARYGYNNSRLFKRKLEEPTNGSANYPQP